MSDFKTATITEKLNYIQHELKVKKSNVNSFAKFNYRTLDDIFENVKPLLDKTSCIITISDELVDTIKKLSDRIPNISGLFADSLKQTTD